MLGALVSAPPRRYQPTLSSIERAAYQAAHELMATDLSSDRGTPGGRRSHMVDRIAEIILKAMRRQRRS